MRLSGQDSVRGTFSHRHAALVDQKTGEEYMPLAHLSPQQARFEVYDSLLSEAAVLGFEYGYSGADPSTLTIWEAQFGDFANGAQVIIDQFIVSAHVKWQRMSGLVMLLPHGYEGQGPEHSSARIERFLQSCADDNLQIVNCTTPAQYFHVLRRQMRRRYRTPLVIFTPKSLLRLPEAMSTPRDLATGGFERLIGDPLAAAAPEQVERLILCSGKVYYELRAEREQRLPGAAGRVAIARLEQLYPWPEEEIAELRAALPARRAGGLRAGGAGQHGRLDLRARAAPGRAAADAEARLRRASRERLAGGRLDADPQGGAGRPPRCRLPGDRLIRRSTLMLFAACAGLLGASPGDEVGALAHAGPGGAGARRPARRAARRRRGARARRGAARRPRAARRADGPGAGRGAAHARARR